MDTITTIRKYLARCGCTNADLARGIGVTQAAVSKWMKGESQISNKNLVAVAEWLSTKMNRTVTVEELTEIESASASPPPAAQEPNGIESPVTPQSIAEAVIDMSDEELLAVANQEYIAFYGKPEREYDRETLELVAAKAMGTTERQAVSITRWARERASDEQLVRALAIISAELQKRQKK